MKKLITIIAIALFTLSATAQKVGHVDVQTIMVDLPSYKAASAELERFAQEKKSELDMFYKLYQESEAKFKQDAPSLSDEIKEQRYAELMAKGQNIQAKNGQFEQEVALKEQKLVDPIMASVKAAIAKVAKEGGYIYVFEQSTLMYYAEAESLNAKVIAELAK